VISLDARSWSRIVPPASTTWFSMCAQSAPMPLRSCVSSWCRARVIANARQQRAPRRVRALWSSSPRGMPAPPRSTRVLVPCREIAIDKQSPSLIRTWRCGSLRAPGSWSADANISSSDCSAVCARHSPPEIARAGASHQPATLAMLPMNRIQPSHSATLVLNFSASDRSHRPVAVFADVDRHHFVVELGQKADRALVDPSGTWKKKKARTGDLNR